MGCRSVEIFVREKNNQFFLHVTSKRPHYISETFQHVWEGHRHRAMTLRACRTVPATSVTSNTSLGELDVAQRYLASSLNSESRVRLYLSRPHFIRELGDEFTIPYPGVGMLRCAREQTRQPMMWWCHAIVTRGPLCGRSLTHPDP